MNNNAHSQREVNEAHSLSQATTLLDESRALSYAVVMALAQTPREELSREEIDGLCQLTYELLNKLTKTQEVFQEARQKAATPVIPNVSAVVGDPIGLALVANQPVKRQPHWRTGQHDGAEAIGYPARGDAECGTVPAFLVNSNDMYAKSETSDMGVAAAARAVDRFPRVVRVTATS